MAPRIDDRLLWVGVSLSLFAVTKGIAYGLRRMVDINTIYDADDSKDAAAVARPEDSIPLTTLKTLTESPNIEIRNAAIVLLLNRLARMPATRDLWIDDFFSASQPVRTSAAQLEDLCWTMSKQGLTPAVLEDLAWFIKITLKSDSIAARTIRAAYAHARFFAQRQDMSPILAFRQLSLEMERADEQTVILCPGMTRSQLGPWMQAMRAMMTLRRHRNLGNRTAESKAAKALQRLHEAAENTTIFPEEWRFDSDDESDEEVESLRDLVRPSIFSSGPRTSGLFDSVEGYGLDSHGRRPRFREESPEEAEVRRRRREAMVLHEGTGMVDRNDIIQPDTIGR